MGILVFTCRQTMDLLEAAMHIRTKCSARMRLRNIQIIWA